MNTRVNVASGAPWENKVGYSRAVRIGNMVEVSGTVALDNGAVVGPGDAYVQTRCILSKIEAILEQAGATLKDVIRTRMYVTDINQWEAVGKAHGEYFSEVRPATSMVEVKALISPEYLVEIEATAVLQKEL